MSSLNIFQIREDVTDPDKIIQKRGSLWSQDVRLDRGLLGVVYAQRSFPREPRWLPYFEGRVDFSGVRLTTASSAAVFLLKAGERLYAVVFGYGRWLLEDGAIEPRFGLRVTLNAINPAEIRSIDHTRLEAVSRLTREQLSRASGLVAFGLDVERDLLRAVVGTPSDETLGTRLAGSDQLVVTGDVPLAALKSQPQRYETLSRATRYQENFAWVDNVAETTATDLRERLDEVLVRKLTRGTLDTIWLAPPDLLDWSDVGGFRYRSRQGAPIFDDLRFEDYFEHGRRRRDITPEHLRNDRVHQLSAVDGTDRHSWSIHRCLVAEIRHGGSTFILSEGRWYRVNRDFLEVVDRAISAIPRSTADLPAYRHDSEGDYNQAVAEANQARYACLDTRLVHSSAHGGIEPCDLYTRERQFIHVKRFSGSAALSHLFSQGTVSAHLMLSDERFRREVNDLLPVTHKLADAAAPIRPNEYEVAYAIVPKRGTELRLPFFSKVNLRNAARLLTQLGFRVTLTPIAHN